MKIQEFNPTVFRYAKELDMEPMNPPPPAPPAPPVDGLGRGLERFTDRARKVLCLARQEAARMGHTYIGTEHILLGLVKEGSGVGAHVLGSAGLSLDGLRRSTLDVLGQPDKIAAVRVGKPVEPGLGAADDGPRGSGVDRAVGVVGPPEPAARRDFKPGDLVRHRASGERAVFRGYELGEDMAAVYVGFGPARLVPAVVLEPVN